jgi:trans-aconitate 2-methyltransferase
MTLDAKYYQNNSFIQHKLAHELFTKHRFNLCDSILDIGCGDGKITDEIAHIVDDGKVLGIDQSKEMIKLADATFHGRKNLEFRLFDAADIRGFGEDCYDSIVSVNCLYWIKNIRQALKNIYKSLKPGGIFIGLVYPKESQYYLPFINVLKNNPRWISFYSLSCCDSWMASSEWIGTLKDLGFSDMNSSIIEDCAKYTLADFNAYVKGWLPCLFPATKVQYNDFIKDLNHEVIQHFMKDEMLLIPFTKLHLIMKKN